MKIWAGLVWLCLLTFGLFACATVSSHNKVLLDDGKRAFEAGYYKRALHELLPLACEGNPPAQYAVGYMYYYGLGVSKDQFVGRFWIQRAAEHGNRDAQQAIELIKQS